jgi:ribosomal-protein-alanine N-acetyltransferase
MIDWLSRWFGRSAPIITEARPRDAGEMSALHAASFRRGWSDGEFERLLLERNVVAHRATAGGRLAGFILSRMGGDEAEILSVAVAASMQGRGIGYGLLMLHLRRLAALGVRSVFLEVEEGNAAALKIYAKAGFAEVGRRENYYSDRTGAPATARVLRRDLT